MASTIVKTPEELEIMRVAGKATGTILEEACLLVKPGVTPLQIDAFVEKRCSDLGGTPAFKGYRGFPRSICISVNDEVVHSIPGARPFQEGDIVKLDFGVIVNKYYGDAARTIAVGNITLAQRCLLAVTKQSLDAAIAAMIPGNHLGDVSSAIQTVVESNGMNVFKSLCGHGIGQALHEDPHVLNYGTKGEGLLLKPGMVFAIEPIVTLGKDGLQQMSDKWTLKSKDKAITAHFEDTVVVTDGLAEVLTR